MKLYLMSCVALALLRASNSLSDDEQSPAVGLMGVFAALADEVARLSGPSDYVAADEESDFTDDEMDDAIDDIDDDVDDRIKRWFDGSGSGRGSGGWAGRGSGGRRGDWDGGRQSNSIRHKKRNDGEPKKRNEDNGGESSPVRRKKSNAEKIGAENDDASPSTFGTTLFSELCANSPTGNVLLSPLSVYKALVLVRDGATVGSENERELDAVLGPPSAIEETEEEGAGGDDSSGVRLSMASSVWSRSLIKQSYVDGVVDRYDADAFPMPTRYTDVDEWIEDKTNGMIKGFLGDDKIDPHTVALLVNAVYFKGRWTYEFDPERTVDGDFALRDESTSPARFMTATREMVFNGDTYELGGASMVLLDYGEESDEPSEFTSAFILPASPDDASMDDVISGLNSQPLSDLLDNAFKTKVALKLPRFRLEYGPEGLKSTLQDMGMTDAFDEKILGKFLEMSDDETLFVDDVLHGAVMEVTEEGTEAAATTVVPIRNRSRPRPPPELTFDRPFVVAVVHRTTGTPVFIGRVEEPDLEF